MSSWDLIEEFQSAGMSVAQTFLGLLVVAKVADLEAELQAAPPALLVCLPNGAALCVDRSLNACWIGDPLSWRGAVEAALAQAWDEIHDRGRLRPRGKLMKLAKRAMRQAADDFIAQHKALMATPPVRPNSWGFLERRLAKSAEG